MPKLSIIVPVYNVEKWLSRCIDSILAQTFRDFELILVNDGSPDQCGEIMEDYKRHDSRIVTIHQENGGVSSARNAGLKASRGGYIGFVDPDDWIKPEMYQTMMDAMKSSDDIDLVNIKCKGFYEGMTNSDDMRRKSISSFKLNRDEYLNALFDTPCVWGRNTCSKLFRKSLLQHCYDENLKIGEDVKFLFEYAVNCRNVICIDEPFYNIFVRPGSATRNKESCFSDYILVADEILEWIMHSEILNGLRNKAEYFFLDSCLLYQKSCKNPEDLVRINKLFKSYIKKYFLHILKNIGLKRTMYCLLCLYR